MTLEQRPQGLGVPGLRHQLLPALESLRERRADADLLVAVVATVAEGAPIGGEMEIPAVGDRLVRVYLRPFVELDGVHPHEPGDELVADQPQQGFPGGLDLSRE